MLIRVPDAVSMLALPCELKLKGLGDQSETQVAA